MKLYGIATTDRFTFTWKLNTELYESLERAMQIAESHVKYNEFAMGRINKFPKVVVVEFNSPEDKEE